MIAEDKMAIDFNIHENQRDDDDEGEAGASEEAQNAEEARNQEEVKKTFRIVTIALVILATPHVIAGGVCLITGVILCSKAPIWLAHTISPIWSGVTVSYKCFFH